MKPAIDLSLYLVIGPGHCAGRDMADVAEAAARGGATLSLEEVGPALASMEGFATIGIPVIDRY